MMIAQQMPGLANGSPVNAAISATCANKCSYNRFLYLNNIVATKVYTLAAGTCRNTIYLYVGLGYSILNYIIYTIGRNGLVYQGNNQTTYSKVLLASLNSLCGKGFIGCFYVNALIEQLIQYAWCIEISIIDDIGKL